MSEEQEQERRALSLSHEQLEELAEKLFDKCSEKLTSKLATTVAPEVFKLLQDHLYQEAGKKVLGWIAKMAGILGLGLLYWLNQKGIIKMD